MDQLCKDKNPEKIRIALFKCLSIRVIGDKSTVWHTDTECHFSNRAHF